MRALAFVRSRGPVRQPGATLTGPGQILYDPASGLWKAGGEGIQGRLNRVVSCQTPTSDDKTNTVTTEQTFATAFTFPPNFFHAGRYLKIALGWFITVVSTNIPTYTYRMKLGGTAIFQSAPLAPGSPLAFANIAYGMTFGLVCHTTGAAGQFTCDTPTGDNNFVPIANVAESWPKTFNTAGNLGLDVSVQFGSTTSGGAHAAKLRLLLIEDGE